MTNAEMVRGLHVLIARMHLALAGERELSDDEWALIEDLDRWYQRRKPAVRG